MYFVDGIREPMYRFEWITRPGVKDPNVHGISWLKLSLSDLESYNLLSLFFSLNYFRIDGVSIDIITQGVAISIKTLRSSR